MNHFMMLGENEKTGIRFFSGIERNVAAKMVCALRLFFDGVANKESYVFVEPDYILWHEEDTITFNIENHIPDVDIVFHKHISSDSRSIWLVDPMTGKPLFPPDEYAKRPTSVTIRFDLTKDQMVHLGLIVEIIPRDGSKSRYMLCDPQVGSGPP